MNRVGLGLAVGAGYLLGRTKKLKMAVAVGSLVAGKKMNLGPRALADLVNQQVKNNPQVKEIGDQLREDLRGVGKAASGAMAERQMSALADRLHSRTSKVREQLTGAVPGGDADASEGEGYEEDYEDREGREADGEAEEEPEAEGEEEPEAADGSEERSEPDRKEAAKKAPARKASAKNAPAKKAAKKAPAKKVAAKKTTARKTAARKTASGGNASRGARSRLSKGGGDR